MNHFALLVMLLLFPAEPTPSEVRSWALNTRHVEVLTVNGSVKVIPSRDGRVHITARAHGATISRHVDLRRGAGRVTICEVYPSEDAPSARCRPDGGGVALGIPRRYQRVDFDLAVPVDVPLKISTVNGGIAVVSGLPVVLSSVNGDVDLGTSVGSWAGETFARSTNGDVTIRLPSDTEALVRAASLSRPFRGSGDHEALIRLGESRARLTVSTTSGRLIIRLGARILLESR